MPYHLKKIICDIFKLFFINEIVVGIYMFVQARASCSYPNDQCMHKNASHFNCKHKNSRSSFISIRKFNSFYLWQKKTVFTREKIHIVKIEFVTSGRHTRNLRFLIH